VAAVAQKLGEELEALKACGKMNSNNKLRKRNNQPAVQWHAGNSKGGSVANSAGCCFATSQSCEKTLCIKQQ